MSDAFGPRASGRFGFGFGDNPEDMVFEDSNQGVTPHFLMTDEPDVEATKLEGRPMFRDRETVLLRVAGDDYNVVSKPVDETIKRRFPEAYKKWAANREDNETVSGTPLRMWPMVTRAEITSLNAINVFNVEGLATVADVHLNKSPTLRQLRAKAEAWLAEAKTGAEAMRLAGELEKSNALIVELSERLKTLEDAGAHKGRKAA